MDPTTNHLAACSLPARRWRMRPIATAAIVVATATLAACGSPSNSSQSSTQTAANDVTAGLAAQAAGHLAEAATDYKNAIALDPRNTFAYYDLGLVDQLQGQAAAAEQNYRAALQIDPNYTAALYNLAIIRTGPSPAEAEELYRHVISLEPKNASAHLNLGFLLRSENRISEGNTELSTAVSLDPTLASRIPAGTLTTPTPAPPSSGTPKPSPS